MDQVKAKGALDRFLSQMIVADVRETLSHVDLYDSYKTWCSIDGIEPLSSAMVSREMRNRGYQRKVDPDNRVTWSGLALESRYAAPLPQALKGKRRFRILSVDDIYNMTNEDGTWKGR